MGPVKDKHQTQTHGLYHTHLLFKALREGRQVNFEIVNFPFLDGDVPRSPPYGVYISQLIPFARVSSNVEDFNNRNLF